MIDPNTIPGFIYEIGRGESSREENCIYLWSNYYRVMRQSVNKPQDAPRDWIAVGSVKWVESVLFYQLGMSTMRKVWRVKPDYYPTFLSKYLYREVGTCNLYEPSKKARFIKPLNGYKDFEAYVSPASDSTAYGQGISLACYSDVIDGGFEDEYRYYMLNGKCIGGYWYQGKSEKSNYHPPAAPELPTDIEWPDNYCGAVDFGIEAKTGRFTLVEAQHPYSCGWYGETDLEGAGKYVEWLVKGYEYMKKGIGDGIIEC